MKTLWIDGEPHRCDFIDLFEKDNEFVIITVTEQCDYIFKYSYKDYFIDNNGDYHFTDCTEEAEMININ